MKLQRRFAPTSGEFTPESVARFTGICTLTQISSVVGTISSLEENIER